MSFLDSDIDSAGAPMSAGPDGADDVVNMGDFKSWEIRKPMSPDHVSLSSASSMDRLSDFPSISDTYFPSLYSAESRLRSRRSLFESDHGADLNRSRRSRSVSHSLVSRHSSNRRFRRSPYSAEPARRNSISSGNAVSRLPMSLPGTSCCSPVEERQDDFLLDPVPTFDLFTKQDNIAAHHAGSLVGSSMDVGDCASFGDLMNTPHGPYTGRQFFSSSAEESVIEGSISASLGLPGCDEDRNSCEPLGDGSECHEDEPDLYNVLSEEPSVPSQEDMEPKNGELQPAEQDVRFDGDLYTPKYVRGHGNKREGYCGLCKPGRWLVLKNSAFWYDKSFSHGISAATGQPFDAPKKTRRMHGNPGVWEGLCGTCNEWIALISNKKKGTTWFRHAYKVRCVGPLLIFIILTKS